MQLFYANICLRNPTGVVWGSVINVREAIEDVLIVWTVGILGTRVIRCVVVCVLMADAQSRVCDGDCRWSLAAMFKSATAI